MTEGEGLHQLHCYYYGKGPAISNLMEGRTDFTHGVRRDSWYGGWQQQVCVCYESYVKIGCGEFRESKCIQWEIGVSESDSGEKSVC